MPKQLSRGTEPSQVSTPFSPLIEWLNGPQSDAKRERIRQLLRDLKTRREIYARAEEAAGDEGISGIAFKKDGVLFYQLVGPEMDKHRELGSKCRRLLSRYKFWPAIGVGGGSAWIPISSPDGRYKKRWPPTDWDDVAAIHQLSYMPGDEDYRRVAECTCGTWIYRTFSHQRFCSAKCRDKFHKSSPEFKAKRRLKARQYYALHKNKNIR